MKMSSAFQLFKSYYPLAAPWGISISCGRGVATVFDRQRRFRLEMLPPRPRAGSPGSLAAQFADDNRRELFMMREARNLYGIVYAENLGNDFRLIEMSASAPRLPQPYASPLRLSYLLALAGTACGGRYSAESATITCDGVSRIVANPGIPVTVTVSPGGKVSTALGGNAPLETADSLTLRYARLYWRDNAEWFANFAARRLELL